jgi:hypothetical protein
MTNYSDYYRILGILIEIETPPPSKWRGVDEIRIQLNGFEVRRF